MVLPLTAGGSASQGPHLSGSETARPPTSSASWLPPSGQWRAQQLTGGRGSVPLITLPASVRGTRISERVPVVLLLDEIFERIGAFLTGDDSFRILLTGAVSRGLWEWRREDRLVTLELFRTMALRTPTSPVSPSESPPRSTRSGPFSDIEAELNRQDDCWGI